MKLEEFIHVCQILSTRPMEATSILSNYREQENTLIECTSFIQSDNIDLNILFQACLILQYSFLKHWNQITNEYKQELENIILILIYKLHLQTNNNNFVINKMIEIYILIYKHGWPDMNNQQRSILFDKMNSFLTQSNPQSILTGIYILYTTFILIRPCFYYIPLFIMLLLRILMSIFIQSVCITSNTHTYT